MTFDSIFVDGMFLMLEALSRIYLRVFLLLKTSFSGLVFVDGLPSLNIILISGSWTLISVHSSFISVWSKSFLTVLFLSSLSGTLNSIRCMALIFWSSISRISLRTSSCNVFFISCLISSNNEGLMAVTSFLILSPIPNLMSWTSSSSCVNLLFVVTSIDFNWTDIPVRLGKFCLQELHVRIKFCSVSSDNAKAIWLAGIRIMCPSEATCLPSDSCFSDLAL